MEWLVVGAEQAQEAIRRAFFYAYILGVDSWCFLAVHKMGLVFVGKAWDWDVRVL